VEQPGGFSSMQTGTLKLIVAKGGNGVVIDGLGLSAA
jgi:hypothetical protein